MWCSLRLRKLACASRDWPARSQQKEDPFVGFSALQPLFQIKDGIASVPPAKLRFFNAASFLVHKPAGSFRVFCFGGSTTYGHPLTAEQRSSVVADLIQAGSPEKTAEVINAGGIRTHRTALFPSCARPCGTSPISWSSTWGTTSFWNADLRSAVRSGRNPDSGEIRSGAIEHLSGT